MPKIDLYALPAHAPPERLRNATVIVVDLLRASTTICTALANGAECVMPFAEIDETLAAAERFGRAQVLLGGERGGQLIPGFDLVNSPAEYTPERVAGRRILFTTTNGARALHHARGAHRILVGAAVNRTAVAQAVGRSSDVAILCAGTDGKIAREDRLAGGIIVEAIMYASGLSWTPNVAANTALNDWRGLRETADSGESGPVEYVLAKHIRNTDGGRNLIAIGQDYDLPTCAQLDMFNVVPQLDPATNELRPA